jgi:hypothetical protein
LPLYGQSASQNDIDDGTSPRTQNENVIVFPTKFVVESVYRIPEYVPVVVGKMTVATSPGRPFGPGIVPCVTLVGLVASHVHFVKSREFGM